jgi:hypothetical protein
MCGWGVRGDMTRNDKGARTLCECVCLGWDAAFGHRWQTPHQGDPRKGSGRPSPHHPNPRPSPAPSHFVTPQTASAPFSIWSAT